MGFEEEKVNVDVEIAESNSRGLKHKELVSGHYKKPENGVFDNVTASVLEALHSDNDDNNSNTKELGGERDSDSILQSP